MRLFQIIAFILSIVFLVWFIIFATSDGRISNTEFMPVGVVYGLFMIAYCAVNLFGNSAPNNNKIDHMV